MDRAIPVGNKICAQKNRQRSWELHQQRLKSMKAQVDTTAPLVCHFDHLRSNMKREQQLEERYCEIDRENRILLQKMTDIMHQAPATRSRSGPPSLNNDRRKTELSRITQENLGILSRIRKAQPMYNHIEWEDSFRQSSVYLRNCCEYPPALPRRTPSRGAALAPLPGANGPERGGGELRYVLKEGTTLNGKHFLLEMATDGGVLNVSAYDGDEHALQLFVSEKNHRRLYSECDGNYSLIAKQVCLQDGQLVLGETS